MTERRYRQTKESERFTRLIPLIHAGTTVWVLVQILPQFIGTGIGTGRDGYKNANIALHHALCITDNTTQRGQLTITSVLTHSHLVSHVAVPVVHPIEDGASLWVKVVPNGYLTCPIPPHAYPCMPHTPPCGSRLCLVHPWRPALTWCAERVPNPNTKGGSWLCRRGQGYAGDRTG